MESLQKHPMTVFEYMENNKIVIDSKYIKLFWKPTFNKSWIYLSSFMITKEMGYSKLSNFYGQVLYKHYKENIDYKKTDENDPSVKLFKNSISTCKTPHKRGTKQKYYLVSGRALKKMLMRCRTKKSESVYDYFIQIETLYIQYTKYQCEFYKTNFKENKQKLIDESVIHTRRIRIKELEENLYQKYKIGCVYYIKCGDYTKIGYTFNLPERLQTLQVSNPIKLIVVKTELCQFPNIRETYLHKKYKHLCVRGEWFNI
jgi:hypothetical protein